MWSYQVKLYEERELAVLDVMREERGVTVNTIPSLTDHTQSVILAQVLQANNPVLDARVTATISGPGGDTGVYSAFIPVFARYAGYHSVRVSMECQEETSVNILRGVGGRERGDVGTVWGGERGGGLKII